MKKKLRINVAKIVVQVLYFAFAYMVVSQITYSLTDYQLWVAAIGAIGLYCLGFYEGITGLHKEKYINRKE